MIFELGLQIHRRLTIGHLSEGGNGYEMRSGKYVKVFYNEKIMENNCTFEEGKEYGLIDVGIINAKIPGDFNRYNNGIWINTLKNKFQFFATVTLCQSGVAIVNKHIPAFQNHWFWLPV